MIFKNSLRSLRKSTMLFNYSALDETGAEKTGSIDAINIDVAITSLQRRGLVISSIKPAESGSLLERRLSFFDRVSNKDLVILSRQIATLFEAQVSALRVFRLLAAESEKPLAKRTLAEITDDLQGGSSISRALGRHPAVFSDFYVNMVHAGEESGKLDETFLYLADYLDRAYEINSRARSALVYPAFVIITFIGVMIFLLTVVIPKLASILTESNQEIPLYTRVVLGVSDFFVTYGVFLLIFLILGGLFFWRYGRSEGGKLSRDRFKLAVPYVGTLYKKLYLSRIADNMNTMLIAGIPMVRAIELTATVVGSEVYRTILDEAGESIKSGMPVSEALGRYPEIPGIMIAMVRVGEETGELGKILKTLSVFYRREVENAVNALISLIEPALIVALGLGVGFLLASVLIPIYNISVNV